MFELEMVIPLYQFFLFVSLISFCLLLSRYKIGLSITFCFLLYWAFIHNSELFAKNEGAFFSFFSFLT